MNNEMYICEKILVVDDTKIDRLIAEKMILKFGLAKEVICLESALDALQFLKDNASSPGMLPQLIFMDIKMPQMDGLEFLEVFDGLPVAVRDTCKVAMLTSSLDTNDEQQAMKYRSVCAFLHKPLSQENMQELSKKFGQAKVGDLVLNNSNQL